MLRSNKYFLGVVMLFIAAFVMGTPLISRGDQSSGTAAAQGDTASETSTKQTEAKSRNDEAAAQDIEFDSIQQNVQRLKMALGVCFSYPKNVSPNTEVTIGFSLNEQGGLEGIPDLLGDPAETADVRRVYLRGLIALEECAPFPSYSKGGNYIAVLSESGIKTLKDKFESERERSPSVRSAMFAVHNPATQESEDALSLGRSERYEIQRRLELLEFDPQGADGVFGQNTRDAISSWQNDKGFPVTGYLNAVQLLALNAQSQARYDEYSASNAHSEDPTKRVRVCRRTGMLGIKFCRYEYR